MWGRARHPRHGPLLWGLVVLLLVALLVPGGVRADGPAPAPAASFSGEAALQHVYYLAETIGSRPAGSAQEAAAAAYLAAELTRYGYQTEIQPFPIQVYEERGARVTLLPEGTSVETTALFYSASGEVSGALADAGLGRPGDWAPGALDGRVALIERGEIPFAEKVANVAAAGAVAAIVFNNVDGGYTGTLQRPAPIPAVTLPRAQGLALRERLQHEDLSVQVTVDAQLATRESRNVVGVRPGAQPGAVVVGGHFDSVPAGPGANDNASGTATVLELARVMASRDYPYTLYFVAFGAEEIGLRGSQYFVSTLAPEARQALRAMVNLDMVGVGDEQRLAGSRELVELGRAVAETLGIARLQVSSGASAGASSDHESFQRVGVPVLFVHRMPDPNYHSPGDRAEHVEPQYLALAGQLVLGVLERLATAEQ
ncbi:MAG TPA: M28 family metallopeptidase [Chloroflexota bacterium]|nr:M28 family metallopeptidase [Chloroflexota bacterium]